MTKNQAKEIIGDHLLKSMKNIDEALMMIHQLPDDYNKEVSELRDNKASLKRVLNKHFDACAIANYKK